MKKITPYLTREEALQALDNGGRFYNLFSSAGDDVLTTAEVGKVAGVITGRQEAILFLELALSRLSVEDKQAILEKADKTLAKAYEKYSPSYHSDIVYPESVSVSSGLILSGIPKHLSENTTPAGFVLIPVMVGKITVIIPVPVTDIYNTYRTDEKGILLAQSDKKNLLPEKPLMLGGVIKELRTEKGQENPDGKFLEILFYCEND